MLRGRWGEKNHRYARGLASIAAWLALLLGVSWATLALWFDASPIHWFSGLLAAIFLGACLVILQKMPRRRAMAVLAGMVGLIVLLWNLIPPSNNRNWIPVMARLPRATIQGNTLTVHNLRNFDHHSRSDFTARWETRNYDLERLRGMDMFLCSWGSPWIAHTISSWDFGDGEHLAISIETRKEEGESYSPIRGFFRQYELYYVVAEERDVIRLRTNYRGHTVHLYHLKLPTELARALLLDFLAEVNELNERPQWYNALTCNCTTAIRHHARRVAQVHPWNWRILLNGRLEELAYERRTIDTSMPLPQLIRISDITRRAQAIDANADDFSEQIRTGLPGAGRLASVPGR